MNLNKPLQINTHNNALTVTQSKIVHNQLTTNK